MLRDFSQIARAKAHLYDIIFYDDFMILADRGPDQSFVRAKNEACPQDGILAFLAPEPLKSPDDRVKSSWAVADRKARGTRDNSVPGAPGAIRYVRFTPTPGGHPRG
jgi:hypothetical protein